jgi:hypothetical protein
LWNAAAKALCDTSSATAHNPAARIGKASVSITIPKPSRSTDKSEHFLTIRHGFALPTRPTSPTRPTPDAPLLCASALNPLFLKNPHFSEPKSCFRTYTDWTADVQPSPLNFSQKIKNHEHRFQHRSLRSTTSTERPTAHSSNSIQQKEKQFEKWVTREDVMAKLNAKKEPGGLTDETVKEILEKLNLM